MAGSGSSSIDYLPHGHCGYCELLFNFDSDSLQCPRCRRELTPDCIVQDSCSEAATPANGDGSGEGERGIGGEGEGGDSDSGAEFLPHGYCGYCELAFNFDSDSLQCPRCRRELTPDCIVQDSRSEAEPEVDNGAGSGDQDGGGGGESDTGGGVQPTLRCSVCGAEGGANFSELHWRSFCSECRQHYHVTNDFAACPRCQRQAGDGELLLGEALLVCRCGHCDLRDRFLRLGGSAAAAAAAAPAAPAEMLDLTSSLWRLRECNCGNSDPSMFRQQQQQQPEAAAAHSSLLCRCCSRVSGGQAAAAGACPHCGVSSQLVDCVSIDAGDDVVACDACGLAVLQRHVDEEVRELLKQHQQREQQQQPQQQRRQLDDLQLEGRCLSCGSAEVELLVSQLPTERLGIVQRCRSCRQADWLTELPPDEASEATEEVAEFEAEFGGGQEATAGSPIEQLGCCRGLASMHPVDQDTEDNLLVCSVCKKVQSLASVPGAPATVAELRATVQPQYSAGGLGKRRGYAKLTRIEQLQAGDQLELRRLLYSHFAIVAEPLPAEAKVAVVEYNGELDARTVGRALGSKSNKAQVCRSLYSLRQLLDTGARRILYHSLDCYEPSVVLRRVAARFDERRYSLVSGNCEHLANWAKFGRNCCEQVDALKERLLRIVDGEAAKAATGRGRLLLPAASKAAGFGLDVVDDLRREAAAALRLKENSLARFGRGLLRVAVKAAVRGLPLLIAAQWLPAASPLLRLALSPAAGAAGQWAADALLPVDDGEQRVSSE